MFETFYRLSTNPFRLTPDPKFCFRHPSYNQAYAYLQYALRLGEGFIMVTGRPGIGKTTLAEVFLTEIKQNEVIAARIASANVEAEDLLRVVAYSYGIDVAGLDKATILLNLEQFFVRQARSGKRVLLIIDEAQSLPHVALEELRLLADLQMDSRPLLQLFLVGQEKLRDLMREPDMEQFQQRVIGACHLEPLGLQETRSYIEHRLRTAGWKGDPELSGSAVLSLYQYSKGVPRHVNKICTRLLLHGMMEEKHDLDEEDVLSVAEELRVEQLAPMEREDSASADTVKAVSAEFVNDSASIADLALRVDPRDVVEEVGSDAGTEPAREEQPTPRSPQPEPEARYGAAGRAQTQTQGRGGEAAAGPAERRHRPADRDAAGIGEFRGQWRRRPNRTRVSVSSKEAVQAVRSRRPRRSHGDTMAEMFGRLKWKGKLAVFAGAVVVVNLALAFLNTQFFDDSGDHKSLLVGYREPVQEDVGSDPQHIQMARRGDRNDSASVIRNTGRQVAAEPAVDEQTAGTTTAAGRQSDSGQDDWFEAIAETWDKQGIITDPRDSSPVQARSDVAVMNQPVRDTLRAKPKSEAVVDEAGIATDAESSESPTETAGLIGPRERRKTMVSEQRDSPADPAPSPPAKPDQSVTAQAEPTALPVVRTRPELPAAQVIARATPPAAVREDQPVQLEKTTASPADTRQEKITELLALGHKALKRDRLLIPTHDSAYKYYQQALILEPGNDAALLGIERIVARYNVLARKALDKQNEDEGRLYINRGLSINPTDKRLLALRESVNTPTTVAEPESPPVIPVEERAPVAERKAEPNDFLSRLKALFTKKRPTDKRREVVVEER